MTRKKPSSNIILLEEMTVAREIAEMQLDMLRNTAQQRLLTYEEAKIFDILAKNLSLSKGDPTVIAGASQRLTAGQLTEDETKDLISFVEKQAEVRVHDVLNIVKDDNDQGQGSS